MTKLTRREFLKLSASLSAGAFLARLVDSASLPIVGMPAKANVIILLFDTMSAPHMSVYGYPRQTTPNLARFAKASTVYHRHYSGGKYTSPGTASLLTGTYPWKHRALTPGALVSRDLANTNLFHLMGDDYYRLAFSQNLYADIFIGQFIRGVDERISPVAFSMPGSTLLLDRLENDRDLSWYVFENHVNALSPYLPASLVLGYAKTIHSLRPTNYYQNGVPGHPYGIPRSENYNIGFVNEDVFAGVSQKIEQLHREQCERPFLAYFHFYAPHEPYKPRAAYNKLFQDGFQPASKPLHPLADTLDEENLLSKRTRYDRYLANVDAEFGKLLDSLQASGVYDNSYIIITSDHGQLFERGDHGHQSPLMYDGVLHIPLIIHAPGQAQQNDIFTPTSNVDVLPTLLSIAGRQIPDGLDGAILPGFGGSLDADRMIFSVDGRQNSTFLPLTMGSVALRMGPHKLIQYLGYPGFDGTCELYNTDVDPDESIDLITVESAIAAEMKALLQGALNAANRELRSGKK